MNRRTRRVASMIQAKIAKMLSQDVSDPMLQGIMVTRVDLTNDLKRAHIFYRVYREPESSSQSQKELARAFARACPYIRKNLGTELKLRSIPELIFQEDSHMESVNRVLSLLHDIESLEGSETAKGESGDVERVPIGS